MAGRQPSASHERLVKEGKPEYQDIDVTEACIQQYGANAISHYRDYSDPYSWYCYDG